MLFSEIIEAIKSRRKFLGITQPHLAELAHISKNTLYKIERGKANPTLKILIAIADVLGMSVDVNTINNEESSSI
jgi:transcriptional regulator with XRE-family HTH domain